MIHESSRACRRVPGSDDPAAGPAGVTVCAAPPRPQCRVNIDLESESETERPYAGYGTVDPAGGGPGPGPGSPSRRTAVDPGDRH
eukprot:86573-Hanusia_phi.AAC.1